MKKYFLIAAVVVILFASCLSVSAQEEANAVYMETYMCGDAYTFKIGAQPQMMSQITEKLNYFIYLRKNSTGKFAPYQLVVRYGKQTEEDVMLQFRIYLRNLNPVTIQGLSPDSFILTGKVRDRVIEYKPEVMMPFEYDWGVPLKYAGINYYIASSGSNDTIVYEINDYWNPLEIKNTLIKSMRVQEIRLIYRVPSWLSGWDLHIKPQPMIPDPQLKSCDMILHLPTISNEITKETYKYIDSSK